MPTKFRTQIIVVWAALVVLTVLLWGLGWEHAAARDGKPSFLIAAILGIAFVKTQIVATFFMELRTAPNALRLAFSTWVVGVGAALIAIYLLA